MKNVGQLEKCFNLRPLDGFRVISAGVRDGVSASLAKS